MHLELLQAFWAQLVIFSSTEHLRRSAKNSFAEGKVLSNSLTPFRVTEAVTAKMTESAYHQIERDGILATRLCTHKDDVELTNQNKLQQLPGLNSSSPPLFFVFLSWIQLKIGLSHVVFSLIWHHLFLTHVLSLFWCTFNSICNL